MTISQGPSALAPEVQDSAPGVPSRVQNHFSQRSFTQPNVVPKQNFAVSNDPSNVRVGMGPGLSSLLHVELLHPEECAVIGDFLEQYLL